MNKINRKNQTYIVERHRNGETILETRNYYTIKDFNLECDGGRPGFREAIIEAKQMWNDLALTTIKDGVDMSEGSCVSGDNIVVDILTPRCRYIKKATIVLSPAVQGSVTKEITVKPVLEFLRSKGIECRYDEGWMN